MKRLSLMALLLVFCIAASGVAETAATRGKIELDLPNAPAAQDEINLDKTFFALFTNFMAHMPEYATYAEMIEGVCIRVYDKAEDLGSVRNHHANRLKAEKWDTLIKIREMLHVSLLFAEEPGVVNGIFVAFTDDGNVGFANIYGTIDFEKLGILFGKLMESELVREFLKNAEVEIESKDGKTKD